MMLLNKIIAKFNISGNKRKIIKNVYWAVLGKIINILSGLFVGILVARYLGPDNFGLMNYIISYVTLFSILANFGLDNIEIRELSKKDVDVNAILGTAFMLRIAFSIITLILVIGTLVIFESDSFTYWMVIVYSSSLVLNSFNVIRNYFTSIVLNEYVVKTEITGTLIGSGIKIILLIFHFSLGWFIFASSFDFLLIAGGYLFSYRAKVGDIKLWYFDKKIAEYLIKQSFPLLLSGTAIIIYQKIDQVMLRNMIDNAAVGQFSVASKIADIAVFIPITIAQSITPILVKVYEESKIKYFEKRQQFMDIIVWSSVFISLIIFLFANSVINILFGDKYLEAIPVLQIMAWKAVFVSLFVASGQIIIIENLQKFAVIRNFIGCLICVLLNLVFIPRWGIVGAAWVTIITFSVTGFLSHLIIKPYFFLFKIQTNTILFKRLFNRDKI